MCAIYIIFFWSLNYLLQTLDEKSVEANSLN